MDEPRAKALAEVLAHTAPAIARAVEARVLPEATGLSTARLKTRVLELLLELDADAVDARREDAKRQADVRSYPSHLEGMSTLAADLPSPVSAECLDVVDQLAAMLKADGDARPIGELRAAVLADLIRRALGHASPRRHRSTGHHRAAALPHRAVGPAGRSERAADHRRPLARTGRPAGPARATGPRMRLADLRDHRP